MIIRSFVADSVAAALKEVRTQMGGNAVVLKTREVALKAGSHQFEVTACLDNPSAGQASKALAAPTVATAVAPEPKLGRTDTGSRLTPEVLAETGVDLAAVTARLNNLETRLTDLAQRDVLMAAGLSTRLSAVYDAVAALQASDVPVEWIASFFRDLQANHELADITTDTVQTELAKRLTEMVDTRIVFEPGDRVLVTGPSGAGKTSVLGKLASSLVIDKKTSVSLVSLDSYKVGAIDEIESYGDLLGVTVEDPSTLASLSPADSRSPRTKTVTLIDTGTLLTDRTRLADQIKDYLKVGSTHRLLVFSATMRTSDLQDFCHRLADLKPTHVVMTGADLTCCRGGIIAAVQTCGARLVLLADSPSGTGKLRSAEPEIIARELLNREVTRA